MFRTRKLPYVVMAAFLLSVDAAPAFSEDNSHFNQRSKDTHAIDEFPEFDRHGEDTANQEVEKDAERQLQEGELNKKEKALKPRGSGDVIDSRQEKKEKSDESTEIRRDNPVGADAAKLPARSTLGRPTVAIALGGGGARGAAHIGVLRVLRDAGIPIDYIVGNSMGSIVGGLYAAGVKLEDIEKIMTDGSLKKAYMPGKLTAKLLFSPIAKIAHPFKKHYAGLWTGNKFGEFLEKQLPEGVENVEDTKIPYSSVATNLIDGKAYRISDGKLSNAIRASSTIPPLLRPVAIGDKLYVDGGVRANLPASAARDTGANIVIGVLVDEPLRILPAKRFQHISGIVGRLGDVMLAVADARQLPFADVIINPDVSGLPVLTAEPEDVQKAIDAGAAAAKKALPAIQKRMAGKIFRSATSSTDGSAASSTP
jgi:predicted acylesterase/phospholipase RssA